jgi:hypothetical protein
MGFEGGPAKLFEACDLPRTGALFAAPQFLQRHLPVEAVEAGSVQVRIGTADGAHGTALDLRAALAAMTGR